MISAAPRLSWLTISKIASSRFSGGVCATSSRPIRRWAAARCVLRDQRIGGFLHAVVDKPVAPSGARPARGGPPPKAPRGPSSSEVPRTIASVAISATLPRQASCCSASWVSSGRRVELARP